jgi:hypothetical protein
MMTPERLGEGEFVNGIAVAGSTAASTVPMASAAARAIEAKFLKAPILCWNCVP